MFCLLSISSLHKYTIGWLRFKWNWIRIHFRSCSHSSLKQMNSFCIRRNLKFTKDNNRVFQLKQLNNIHIKMSWIIIKLWIYNDYKLVYCVASTVCLSPLKWFHYKLTDLSTTFVNIITLSKSHELKIERVIINDYCFANNWKGFWLRKELHPDQLVIPHFFRTHPLQ